MFAQSPGLLGPAKVSHLAGTVLPTKLTGLKQSGCPGLRFLKSSYNLLETLDLSSWVKVAAAAALSSETGIHWVCSAGGIVLCGVSAF